MMLNAESEIPFLYSAKNVLPARAKLNLSLSILGQRADGYHDLQSVMVTIAFADRLHIAMTRSSRSTQCIDVGDDNDTCSCLASAAVSGSDTGTSFDEVTALEWRVGTDLASIPDDRGHCLKAALAFCCVADIAPASMIFSADIEKISLKKPDWAAEHRRGGSLRFPLRMATGRS